MKITVLLLTLVMVSSCSCNKGSEVKAKRQLSATDNILAIGDSLTYGIGAGPSQSYPSYLQSISKIKVINSGISGETSGELLERIEMELDSYNPSFVILCIGGNDILRKHPSADTLNNISEIIEIIKARDIDLMLIGVPNFSLIGGMKTVDLYDQLASKYQVIYLRDALTELLSKRGYKSDQIHLNAKGYKKLAEQIHKELISSGAI